MHTMLAAAETAFADQDMRSFCDEVAASMSMCEKSWQMWSFDNTPPPALSSIRFEPESLADGTLRLTVTGRYANGAALLSQVQVVRDEDGTPKAVDPVFWVPRRIVDSEP